MAAAPIVPARVASAPPPAAAPSPATVPAPRQAASAPRGAQACHGEQSCETLLQSLIDSPDHAWLRTAETPATILSGVRMLALRKLRTQLRCEEIDLAMEQMAGVPAALRTPPRGSRAEDVTGATVRAAEVRDELSGEKSLRCGDDPAALKAPERAPPAAAPQASSEADRPSASAAPALPSPPQPRTEPTSTTVRASRPQ